MLPDRSLLIWQKLVENAKIETFKYDILSDFQTLCNVRLQLNDPQRHFLRVAADAPEAIRVSSPHLPIVIYSSYHFFDHLLMSFYITRGSRINYVPYKIAFDLVVA